ncbi:GTP 3',8-cyclase MoaA [uncultured Sphingomonas sp.]|uniref:GTP 3',8-cyclase MoaA n=1 Tax=uncultured Sphingomonas sp. TaxID=158754 RepID=UPI0035C99DDD
MAPVPPLNDRHGRTITYLRVSVTDRCDLRCRYCMAEDMTFLPRADLLDLSEIAVIAERFIARGVTRIRLTGGEPLMRGGVLDLARRLGGHVGRGLDELTLTTNATQLARHARALVGAGIRRINVSLDSLDPNRFRMITRTGDLDRVLGGIVAAKAAGLAIKINMVVLKGLNDDEVAAMLAWCVAQGHDLSLIETMPLGAIEDDRADYFMPLSAILENLAQSLDLTRDDRRTGGPARYWRVGASATRLGLISPLTANFCDGCNRMRLTTDGRLYACLGHDDQADLKQALRAGGVAGLDAAIDDALAIKPARHAFAIERGGRPAVARHMSVTGG